MLWVSVVPTGTALGRTEFVHCLRIYRRRAGRACEPRSLVADQWTSSRYELYADELITSGVWPGSMRRSRPVSINAPPGNSIGSRPVLRSHHSPLSTVQVNTPCFLLAAESLTPTPRARRRVRARTAT